MITSLERADRIALHGYGTGRTRDHRGRPHRAEAAKSHHPRL